MATQEKDVLPGAEQVTLEVGAYYVGKQTHFGHFLRMGGFDPDEKEET